MGARIIQFPKVMRTPQETSDEQMLRMVKKLSERLGNSPEQVAAMVSKAEQKQRADRVHRLAEVIQATVGQVRRGGKIDRAGLSDLECKKLDLAEAIAARIHRCPEPA